MIDVVVVDVREHGMEEEWRRMEDDGVETLGRSVVDAHRARAAPNHHPADIQAGQAGIPTVEGGGNQYTTTWNTYIYTSLIPCIIVYVSPPLLDLLTCEITHVDHVASRWCLSGAPAVRHS